MIERLRGANTEDGNPLAEASKNRRESMGGGETVPKQRTGSLYGAGLIWAEKLSVGR